MKLAASIRYGGELVCAAEIDYDAYRHLGLVCPHCSDPVFLAAAHERHLATGVISQVPAQFRHFKASDPVMVRACVARVEQYDQKEVMRRAAVARNQRLKLMQRWFWHIMTDRAPGIVPFLDDPEVEADRFMTQQVIVALVRDKFAERCNKDAAHSIKIVMDIPAEDREVTNPRLLHDLDRLTQVDLRLHLAICAEVFAFLQSRSSTHMLNQLIVASAGLTYYSSAGKKALDKGVDIAELTYRKLIGLIAIIPWGDEFSKHGEAKKLQVVTAAT